MNPFFIEILDRQIGLLNFGAFEVFSLKLSSPILLLCSGCEALPCPVFFSNQQLFLQKTKPLALYKNPAKIPKNIWEWELNLGRKELGVLSWCEAKLMLFSD